MNLEAQATKNKSSLLLKLLTAFVILLFIAFTGLLGITIVAQSLGAFVRLAPSLILGLISSILLILYVKGKLHKSFEIAALIFTGIFVVSCILSFRFLWMFLIPAVTPITAVPNGNPWVIEGNIFNVNDYNNAVVIKLDDGRYRMYFHDFDDMDSAISTDGIHFTLEPGVRFQGQMPTIVEYEPGHWRIYYMSPNSANHPHYLESAISTDAYTWTPDAGDRLKAGGQYDKDTIIHPSVVKLPDGTYKLYYDGEVEEPSPFAMVTKYRKILSATSTDGLNWTKDAGIRIDNDNLYTWEAYSPKAHYEDSKIILYFTTPNGIFVASSTNTLDFTISASPVFSPGVSLPLPSNDETTPGSYQDSFVLPVDGGNRMYFWIAGQGIFSAFQKK